MSGPVGKVNGIPQLRIVDGLAITLKNLEMNLMDVEGVHFLRVILHGPVLYRPKWHADVWSGLEQVEDLRRKGLFGNEEQGWAIGLAWVL